MPEIQGLSADELRVIERYREAKIRSREIAGNGCDGPKSAVGREFVLPPVGDGFKTTCYLVVTSWSLDPRNKS